MQIEPPSLLRQGRAKGPSAHASQQEEELAMLFENHDQTQGGPNDEQRGGAKCVFADEDYGEDNRTYNRVKSYSFARVM